MIDYFKKLLNEESLAERNQRMIPAMLYGGIIGMVYTLTLSIINVWGFPELPIGFDWVKVLGLMAGYALGLAIFGAIASWFTEEYAGIVGGGVIITIILGLLFIITGRSMNNTTISQSIITVLPLVGVCMLAAWGLRWIVRRHLEIIHANQPGRARTILIRHFLIVFLIGFVPGVFNRMDLPAQQTLTQLHELLQAAPDDPSLWPRLPFKQVPALKDHLGVPYLLYPNRSVLSAGSLDVTIRFADGYEMVCILPVNSGANFISDCVEGSDVKILQ